MPFPTHPDAQARWDMLTHVAASQADESSTDPDPPGRRGELASAVSAGSQAKPVGA